MRAPDGQLQQIKMRVSEELRSKLEKAAAENGWPINKEINARLEATFAKEDAFGSRENARIFEVLGQAIHDLEQRTDGRWTRDYHIWRSARLLVAARMEQLMPTLENAELIAKLSLEEEQAEEQLSAAAERYNEAFAPVLGDHVQLVASLDGQIRDGTFDSYECSASEKAYRARYREMYDANQRLLEVRKRIQEITTPQQEKQKRHDQVAHEVFETLFKKSEWQIPTQS